MTKTESTKEIDEVLYIDTSQYMSTEFKARRIKMTHRGICNSCNSEDVLIIPRMQEIEIDWGNR